MRKIDNSIWSWLKDERVSIVGTILCPMLSVVIPLVSPLLQIRLNNHEIVTILYFFTICLFDYISLLHHVESLCDTETVERKRTDANEIFSERMPY